MYAQTYVYIYFNARRYLRSRDMVAVSIRVFRRQDNYHCDMLGLQFEKAPLLLPPRVDAFSTAFSLSRAPLSLSHSPLLREFQRFYLSEQIQSLFPPVASPVDLHYMHVQVHVHAYIRMYKMAHTPRTRRGWSTMP